jgi:hypothetical protein
MIDYNVDVSDRETYAVKRVDSDYFGDRGVAPKPREAATARASPSILRQTRSHCRSSWVRGRNSPEANLPGLACPGRYKFA